MHADSMSAKHFSLKDILGLRAIERDEFEGCGPSYPWGGLYGGQILAQSLIAAAKTVEGAGEAPFLPHSLHAYFIRSGRMGAAVRYHVTRLRDGRSFATRRIQAIQSDELIAEAICSFHRPEPSLDLQRESRPMPPQSRLERHRWSPIVDRLYLPETSDDAHAALMRFDEKLDDAPELHFAGLAFLSDDLPTEALGLFRPEHLIPGRDPWPFFSASLDHAIHFHAPLRVDEYHLHVFRATRFNGARGLSRGEVFSAEGIHVASVVQEILLRKKR